MGKTPLKRLIIFCAVAAVIGLLLFATKGKQASRMLEDLILPELSLITGKDVTARQFSLNLFPLFLEARDLKIRGKRGEILLVPQVKGYIGLSGLLKKEIILRRLVIREPTFVSSEEEMQEVLRSIQAYIESETRHQITVVFRAVVLEKGNADFVYRDISLKGKGIRAEAFFNGKGKETRAQSLRIQFQGDEVSVLTKDLPAVTIAIKGTAGFRDGTVEVKDLEVSLSGSKITADGTYRAEDKTEVGLREQKDSGGFRFYLDFLAGSLKRTFQLKEQGEGAVTAKGHLKINGDRIASSVLDMEVKGNFYLETLFELLKVHEPMKGRLEFAGNLKGPLDNLTGSAKARLKQGSLYTVAVDDMRCAVAYREKKLHFTEGKGDLYNGTAVAEAAVSIGGDGWFALQIDFADIDSPALFKLISWDPGIPFGTVRGTLKTEGTEFAPSGTFSYESKKPGEDVLGRIRGIQGSYHFRSGLVTLPDVAIQTGHSDFGLSGTVNIDSSDLSLAVRLKTSDITDLTMPYSNDLRGSGEFSGTLKGKSDDPIISGKVRVRDAFYETLRIGEGEGQGEYRKSLLSVQGFTSRVSDQSGQPVDFSLQGTVRFPEAKELFDLKQPRYNLSVSVKNTAVGGVVPLVYRKPLKQRITGNLDGAVTISGTGAEPAFRGSGRLANAAVDTFDLGSVKLSFSYEKQNLTVDEFSVQKGSSSLTARGSLFKDDRISFQASGSRIMLKDLPLAWTPPEANITFKAEGKGTLEDPEMELQGTFHEGKFRNVEIGSGTIRAGLKNRSLTVEALLLGNRVSFNGKASMAGEMPWTGRLEVKPGRYDFLLTSFMRDIPEDILINLKGHADLSGDRNHFSAKAAVNQLNVTLYGYSFTNDSDMTVEVYDRKVSFSTVRMRSGNTAFRISGGLEIGSSYDIIMEGSSDLSLIRGFTKRIDAIRGDGKFVFSVRGKWDAPKVDGGVSIANGVFGLKGVPYRISSINGYLYMDEDRIIIQEFSGKAGGGEVDITGVAYLKGFSVKRFYIDVILNSIGGNVSENFSVNFSGNILLKGTIDSQMVSGEIRVNRAKYRERIDWKSLLLKAKAKEKPKGELGIFENTSLNIKVIGEDNISVDNNIARGELKVDMLLRGTVVQPNLLGRVELKNGTVYFRNNDFRIISGSADFSDPRRINPIMAIAAETSLKGYNIRLNLEGQIDSFTMALVSDPPLDEVDILGLLTVGRVGKELKGIESGVGAGEATSFLTGKMQDVFEERIRSITGIDRIEVDPYVSKVTGTVNPRVTVSKRLFGDKLYVTYSSTVGSTEYNLLKVEYVVSKGLSLIGMLDERSVFGGDVKFRFEFK